MFVHAAAGFSREIQPFQEKTTKVLFVMIAALQKHLKNLHLIIFAQIKVIKSN